jgi:hypothetical protein
MTAQEYQSQSDPAGQFVEIELLGVARLVTRRETVAVPLSGPTALAEVTRALATELPALVGVVLAEDGGLIAGHVLSRNGTDLLRAPDEPIHPGDRLLLLSTTAGG